uniref:Uncharacterized protein n=1 Tax=Fusarium oxysporum (strain Fo5176) TaxID=660025 RepID=A0A0D2XHJ7_FUSOF
MATQERVEDLWETIRTRTAMSL